MRTKVVLFFVLFLALAIRFSGASLLQRGFDGDEAAFGYYGYSLSHNLSDEYGNKLPLYFPSVGDYKYPVYAYLSAIPVIIFNLNEFSARFISVIAGSILALVVYFISRELFKDRNVAFISAFMTAISPYGIMFSSGAYESNLATTLVASGILFFIRYLKSEKRKELIISLLFFFVSIFTYSSSRLFLLLLLPAIYLFVVKNLKINKKKVFVAIVAFIVSTVLLSINIRSRVRANDIAVFGKSSSASYVKAESLGEDMWVFSGKKIKVLEIVHSEYVIKIMDIAQNYFEHFSPEYLFLNGNPNMPKYSIPHMGLFYLFECMTMFLGILFLAKEKSKLKNIIFLWLFISPIPSSLTIETPNPIRMLVGLPAFILLSSLGIYYLIDYFKKQRKLIIGLISLIITANMVYFWHQFSIHDIYHLPWYTDGGMKQMVSLVSKQSKNFDKVVIGGDPYIFFLFYNKVSPKDFIANSVISEESPGVWERVESYNNIIFKMNTACPKIGRLNVLYVCKGNEIPQNSVLHDVVAFNDSVPAFLLIEFVPYSKRQVQDLPVNIKYMVDTDLSFEEGLLSEDSGRYW